MLHPQTLDFLKGLEDFNDKKFFELYKPLYLKIKEQFENLVDFVIKDIAEFDDNILWVETKKCTYRIYKDMRFPRNRDKPYKINIWANISKWWKTSTFAWYYIHIQNNASFFWWWLFFLEPKTANTIRKYIYKNRKEFEKIINNPEFIKTFGSVISYHPKLKKLPKEFDENHPSNEYILHRDWLVNKKIKNSSVLSKNFRTNIIKYAKILEPLNTFLNKAIIS